MPDKRREPLPVPVLILCLLIGLSAACSSIPCRESGCPPQRLANAASTPEEADPIDAYDPLNKVNRAVYYFNAHFDQYLFLPLIQFYEFVTPDYVEQRLSNFFDNLGEIRNFINAALQLKLQRAGSTAGRFVVNSVAGIGGLWDPAVDLGLRREPEDFGQTLGYYGLGPGPYLVLPLFGPSSLRDGVGLAADSLTFNVLLDPFDFDTNGDWQAGYYTLQSIDQRHLQSFRYYQSGSPFEYELVRMLYLKKRVAEIAR